MSTIRRKRQIWVLMILLASVSIPAMGDTSALFTQAGRTSRTEPAQEDSTRRARLSGVNDMAKRVDSLQFIVIYNAELLRQDLGSKVTWIYLMLGVMIVASMMMYGALSQAQRRYKDLDERVSGALSTSVANLEQKIKQLQSKLESPARPRRTAPPKKKKRS